MQHCVQITFLTFVLAPMEKKIYSYQHRLFWARASIKRKNQRRKFSVQKSSHIFNVSTVSQNDIIFKQHHKRSPYISAFSTVWKDYVSVITCYIYKTSFCMLESFPFPQKGTKHLLLFSWIYLLMLLQALLAVWQGMTAKTTYQEF